MTIDKHCTARPRPRRAAVPQAPEVWAEHNPRPSPNELLLVTPRILRIDEVCAITTLSPSHIYALIQRGDFPPLFKLTPNGRAAGIWNTTVYAWLKARARSQEAS